MIREMKLSAAVLGCLLLFPAFSASGREETIRSAALENNPKVKENDSKVKSEDFALSGA